MNIPDSVTSIGNKVFYGCEALTQLYIPSSVTSIGKDAFDDCPHLTLTVERGSAAEKYARDNGIPFVSLTPAEQFETALREDGTLMITEFIGKDENIVVPAKIGGKTVTAIDVGCFYCLHSTISSIRLPDTIQYIGPFAFMSTDITEMEIPASVTIMEENPFWGCDQLKNITIAPGNAQFSLQDSCLIENGAEPRLIAMIDTQAATASIPQGIRIIGKSAFIWNPSLTHVTIPDSVTSIGEDAFSYCEALTEINIPGSVTSIDDYAFLACRGLKQVNILDSVTSIGEGAFSFCEALTEINIPDSVTSIGEGAFCNCEALTEINIPGSVTSIDDHTFNQCRGLKQVNILGSVTSIGNRAFYGCEALTQVNIPDSVTSIDEYAFCGCKALTQVYIPDSVTFIGNNAFDDCPNLTLIVERGSAAEEYANINGNRFIYVTPAEQFNSYTKSNGTVEISAYIGDEESVVIPASIGGKKVTSIQGFATMYCRVKEIQLPNTIEKLNLSAFELALNDTFEIPASVTEITGTLATCSITVAPGNTRFRVENSCLIENGHETRLICGFGAKAKTFVIPEGVTVIGEEAFDYLGYLTRITIPNCHKQFCHFL